MLTPEEKRAIFEQEQHRIEEERFREEVQRSLNKPIHRLRMSHIWLILTLAGAILFIVILVYFND